MDGSVLVVETLGPELYNAIVRSAAVICAGGGRTGHMESLCRSRGIPVLCVDRNELNRLFGQVTVRTDRPSVTLGVAESPVQPQESFAVTTADLVETPAAVHSVPGFCATGASELFVGTKDLVQFYLAADRSNHLVASSYQTRHPAVLAELRQLASSSTP